MALLAAFGSPQHKPHLKTALFQRDRFLRFLNKFLEGRIATQGIPKRRQLKHTVASD